MQPRCFKGAVDQMIQLLTHRETRAPQSTTTPNPGRKRGPESVQNTGSTDMTKWFVTSIWKIEV